MAAAGERLARWRPRVAALFAGAAAVLVFPRIGLDWLAWVVLVPWLALLRGARDWRQAAVAGWLGGAGYLLACEYWLAPDLTAFFPVAVALVGLLWAPWAVLTRRLLSQADTLPGALRALVAVPAGWTLVEAARSWPVLGGAWNPLGASQWRHPAVLGLAALGAVWLVGAAVVAVNTAVLLLLTGRRATRAAAGAAVFVVSAAGPCWFALHQPTGTTSARVTLVQPGLDADPARRLAAGIALTRQPAAPPRSAGTDLVVWGESSVPYDLSSRPDLRARLAALSGAIGAPLLVDVDATRRDGSIAKVSVLLDRRGITGQYIKTRLVPFGEYVPLRSALGWLHLVSKAAAVNRTAGTGPVVLRTAAGLPIGPLTCFESSFPDMARTLAVRGARLVVYQSSTSTFQGSYVQDQQASLLALRAAETGRPVVQAALTGDSAAYDAAGRRLGVLPSTARGTLTVAVPLAARETPYDRFGNTLLFIPLLGVVAAICSLPIRASSRAL
ncbi:apolipoprotein N-acyltransferase [Actinocrinis puniceicyclus]|uniref:Apolipoprotein N-acyltransferase n=1 Tax=Actinocrinis puniceicyclus TaxID=977794 RepID=A0A8J7WMN4_9ACTN|nr:apolipoprotein N-acyltransferase [Actinocrinis puniceicyclus]MBS2962250.1 apolipoprotein N-acyltransferase [Actinocrinis puniceicyclus]